MKRSTIFEVLLGDFGDDEKVYSTINTAEIKRFVKENGTRGMYKILYELAWLQSLLIEENEGAREMPKQLLTEEPTLYDPHIEFTYTSPSSDTDEVSFYK